MPSTTSRDKVDEPCRECRERHLKCDDERPRCRQCARMNHACQRTTGSLKFKSGSTAKHDTLFQKNQPWLSQPPDAKLQFLDEGPGLKHQYTSDDPDEIAVTVKRPAAESNHQHGTLLERTPSASTTRSNASWNLTPTETPTIRTSSIPNRATISPLTTKETKSPLTSLKRPHTDDALPRLRLPFLRDVSQNPEREIKDVYNVYHHHTRDSSIRFGPDMLHEVPRQVVAEYQRLEDDAAGAIPDNGLTPEEWRIHFRWPNNLTTNLCECLMRYFIEELAPWFDVGDPNRTFATVVPYKACFNPPLLNAVFMAASRHLVACKRFRGPDDVIVYKGIQLPTLNKNASAKFLDAVIAYLMRAFDQRFLTDPETLAAAVILRFAGDFEESLTGKEEVAVTSTYQSFIRTRAQEQRDHSLSPPNHRYWMQSSHSPQNNQASYQHIEQQNRQWGREILLSFEHACHRVALRQDVLAGIMYISRQERRPSLDSGLNCASTWSALKSFPLQEGIEDFVWADLHLDHLAQVLRFFMERMESSRSEFREERYRELRAYEGEWERLKPYSFAPYHNQLESRPRQHHAHHGHHHPPSSYSPPPFGLPNTWLLGEVNLVGNQYINLARIVLAELKPSPGIGPERYKTGADVRELVLSICGMAMNTSNSIFAKEIAYAAITLAGPHFRSPHEQDELLRVVQGMETDFGWPVESRINALLNDWNRIPWSAAPSSAAAAAAAATAPEVAEVESIPQKRQRGYGANASTQVRYSPPV